MESIRTLDDARAQVLATVQNPTTQALANIKEIIEKFPDDHLLYFLFASELAQNTDYEDAIHAFEKSVTLFPEFHISRFQLCLLASTLGNDDVINTHLPTLLALDEENYLQAFGYGIYFLLQDEVEQAIAYIQKGIALNKDNAALNQDMKAFIEKITPSLAEDKTNCEDSAPSSTISGSVLLDIYKQKFGSDS